MENLKPIGDLSVIEVTMLLEHLNFEHVAPVLASKGVNGATLEEIESAEEFGEYGIDQKAKRRGLFRKIEDIKKAGGVSRAIFEVKVEPVFRYIIYVYDLLHYLSCSPNAPQCCTGDI